MSRLMEIIYFNQKLRQKQIAKRLGFPNSTLKQSKIDISLTSFRKSSETRPKNLQVNSKEPSPVIESAKLIKSEKSKVGPPNENLRSL